MTARIRRVNACRQKITAVTDRQPITGGKLPPDQAKRHTGKPLHTNTTLAAGHYPQYAMYSATDHTDHTAPLPYRNSGWESHAGSPVLLRGQYKRPAFPHHSHEFILFLHLFASTRSPLAFLSLYQ